MSQRLNYFEQSPELTEAVTRHSEEGISDELYTRVRAQFSETHLGIDFRDRGHQCVESSQHQFWDDPWILRRNAGVNQGWIELLPEKTKEK